MNKALKSDGTTEKENKRLRLLYLDFNVGYINPTRGLLPAALAKAADLTLFGPGYSTPEEVEAGPFAFAERRGPFDAVIGNEYALLRPGFDEAFARTHRFGNHACRFDRSLILKGADYFTFMREFPGPRLLVLLQLDYYGLTEDFIELMEEIGDYYFCWGSEFIRKKFDIVAEGLIPNGINHQVYSRWSDRYFDFVTRKADRILSCPAFVAASEICNRPLKRRPHKWSVLGANYDARVQARGQLEKAGIHHTGAWLPYLHALTQKIGLNPYAHYWSIGLLNALFFKTMRRSCYSYTAGGAGRGPIRKYFEIPANGCVLTAEACSGFEALGFKNRKNAVVCAPKDILDAHAWLESNPNRAQAIAAAGRALIAAQHSVEARAHQFKQCFDRIREDRFCGSHWEKGNLHFHESSSKLQRSQGGLY